VRAPTLPALLPGPQGHLQAPAWSTPTGADRPRPEFGSAFVSTPAIGDA
jgi:hypothetical protein